MNERMVRIRVCVCVVCMCWCLCVMEGCECSGPSYLSLYYDVRHYAVTDRQTDRQLSLCPVLY